MMFPIWVDPAWFENHWYGGSDKARSNRGVIARIAVPLAVMCVAGLFGRHFL
jgi:hypothetical protein